MSGWEKRRRPRGEPGSGSALAPLLENSDEEEHPGEEARRVKVVRDPCAPTKAEREAHEATHLPFRIWCEHCVNGRKDNPPHTRIRDEVEVPEIMFDYAYIRRDEEADTVTVFGNEGPSIQSYAGLGGAKEEHRIRRHHR